MVIEKMDSDIESVNQNLATLPDALRVASNELERLQNSGGDFAFYDRDLQERIKTAKESVKTIKDQIAALEDRKVALDSQPKVDEDQQRSDAVLDGLRLDLAKATAKSESDRLRIQLLSQGVKQKDIMVALSFAMKIKHIEEQKKREIEAAAKSEADRQEQITRARKRQLQIQKDQVKDMISADKARLAALQKQSSQLDAVRGKSSIAGPLQAGKDQRLLSGRTGGQFRKTAEAIELERQTKIHLEQKRIQAEMARLLQSIDAKQERLEVIGN